MAALAVGLGTLLSFAVDVGVLDGERARCMSQRAESGMVEAAKVHVEATSGGDPATRFVEVLRSLFAAGKAYARNKKTGEHPPGHEELGWEDETDEKAADMYWLKRVAEFVGWADSEYLYLDREAAYATVAGFAQRGSIPFGVKPRAVWGALKRAEINLADGGRADTTAAIGEKSKRVVQVRGPRCSREKTLNNRTPITSITTITGFLHIPPPRVAHITVLPGSLYVRNSEGGHYQKSGDNGDSGDEAYVRDEA